MIQRGTKTSWYAISTATRLDFQKKVKVNNLNYEDSMFGFEKKVKRYFHGEDIGTRVLPYANSIKTSITFEVWYLMLLKN